MHSKTSLICVFLGILLVVESVAAQSIRENFDFPGLTAGQKRLDAELAGNTSGLVGELEAKGSLYHDASLEIFLRGLISSRDLGLAEGPLPFRIYIVKDPHFNAFSTPAGDIFLNTGLLSRLRNADQVRFVLGHEMMHLLGKDPVLKRNDFQGKKLMKDLFQLALIPATIIAGQKLGSQYTSLLNATYKLTSKGADAVYVAAVRGYGRELETRADFFGAQVLIRQERDAWQAVRFFEDAIADDLKFSGSQRTYFYSLHDSNLDRLRSLKQYASEKGVAPSLPVADAGYDRLIAGVRKTDAGICLRHGWFWHAMDDLEKVLAGDPRDVEALGLLGESYSLLLSNVALSQKELSPQAWTANVTRDFQTHRVQWAAKSLQCYRAAIRLNPLYPEPHLGLSKLYQILKKPEESRRENEIYQKLKS